MNRVIAEAVAISPFGLRDVYVYCHGWCTDATAMMNEYNRFSVDLAKRILITQSGAPFPNPPAPSLGIGIHWPSEITENPSSPLNDLELFTFYTMEHRADVVGRNAVYSMLRLLLTARAATEPLRIFLLGHSFGCKVLCAALNDLQIDIFNKTIPLLAGTTFRVVLLEPATDNNNLEPCDIYSAVHNLAGSRLLITTSQEDQALTHWYKLANSLTNVFKHATPALGDTGPTADTIAAFGSAARLTVTPGFSSASMYGVADRLIVADLSAIHSMRAASGVYTGGGLSGSHSDINFDELYSMVAGFLYS